MLSLPVEISLSSPEETTRLAVRMAEFLTIGDVLLLEGDIGAGKTHFARSLVQSLLPVPEDVPSPTFTLVQVYDALDFEIWHADLYRLSSPDEVVELGLIDAFETALCLVEWPDRLADLVPESALSLSFAMTDEPGVRKMTINASDPRWSGLLDEVIHELS